jgi:hypothetical protein
VSERDLNPLEKAHTRLHQLRAGGAWLNSSLHLLDVLLSGKTPNVRSTMSETEVDEFVVQKKIGQFDSALKAVYGEIILSAAQRFGNDFVMRASTESLTEYEMSGSFNPSVLLELPEQPTIESGVARG